MDNKPDDDAKPDELEKEKEVKFKVKGLKLQPTLRPGPENIDGQFAFEDGTRYYPTLWILADVQFVGYSYNTRYPPHISLACVAVKLSVEKVEKLKESK